MQPEQQVLASIYSSMAWPAVSGSSIQAPCWGPGGQEPCRLTSAP